MRKRIHPATVISIVALFFSLGGAGFAASHSGRRPSHDARVRTTVVRGVAVMVPTNGGIAAVTAYCPNGTTVIGGGFGGGGGVTVLTSEPVTGVFSYWSVAAVNTGAQRAIIRAVAICATAP